MDMFYKLINRFLESRKNASEPQLDFEYEKVEDNQEIIVTVHTEDDFNFTMSIFDKDQWSMVTDICDLSNKTQEEVIRSLNASAPNILQFTRDDFKSPS